MDLAQLVDLELSLHRDDEIARRGGEAELRARDARIGAAVLAELGLHAGDARVRSHDDRELRQHLLAAWLRQATAGAADGDRLARALRRAGAILTAVLFLLGAVAARAALGYDGKEPVNVFVFLGTLVVPQIALLLLLLWAVLRGRAGLLGTVTRALAQLRVLRGNAATTLGAVSARLHLHADAERWLTFRLAQRAAVAFNLGAVLACVALVALTDLAFGWSTTLQVGADQVHAVCRAIAAPWARLLPDAVPTAELVRDSQWVRMPGRFASGTSLTDAVRQSGRWWSFLVAALVTWGLLPRLLALAFARWRGQRALRQVQFDDHRCQALLDRMLPRAAGWQGPDPAAIALPAEQRAGAHRQGPPPAPVSAGATWLLSWGRLARDGERLAARVERATGARPLGVLAVGGADLGADAAAVRQLGEAKATRVLLLLAAGSQPTKDVLDLLRQLRVRLGPRARLSVALVADDGAPPAAVADDELAGWRASLDRQADPYLGLERLEAHA